MITPDPTTSDLNAAPASAAEQPVPMAALAVDGTAPEVGDTVSFTAQGTVTRIDGENAMVQVTTINGEPVAATAPAKSPDDEVMEAAMQADLENGG